MTVAFDHPEIATPPTPERFAPALAAKHRLGWWELAPFLLLAVVPFVAPEQLPLATQIVVYIIFALSLDLLVGYSGIVTLGHALFFGLGAYTAGILSARGFGEPFLGLVAAMLVAAAIGAGLGAIVLRTARFTLLMLTLSSVFLASEIANKAGWLTGGVDGLTGVETWPLFGKIEFDFFGQTGFLYASAILIVVWAVVRLLVHAPFGQSIAAIRDNRDRAAAIGMGVLPRLVLMFSISAAIAGLAGALQAEITQFVGLKAISFELSAEILVMLALGGAGRIYGAFIGPAVFLVAQDYLSKDNPELWQVWLGLGVIAAVLFARGGLAGLIVSLARRVRP